MPTLYQWDELGDNDIVEAPDYEDRGEEFDGWKICGHLPNGVVIFTTGRHFGCEVWAENPADAKQKMRAWSFFRDTQKAYEEEKAE